MVYSHDQALLLDELPYAHKLVTVTCRGASFHIKNNFLFP